MPNKWPYSDHYWLRGHTGITRSFLSPAASAFRFCATRVRLAMLVHWTENGCCWGNPDRS